MILKETEDGFEFVATNNHKYVVIYEIEGEICDPEVVTASQIFDKMDLSDCYDISVKRLLLADGAKLIGCRFRGTWHNGKDPLKMQIENVITGEVYDVGYGSDH